MLNRLRKAMDERDKGFTLIELLVVIIIIGILAAIAIPVFLNQRKKGVDAGLKSDLKNAATQVETWITDNPQAAIQGSSSATAPATAATAGGSLTGFKASPGNTVTLVNSTGTVGAYCLHAWNPRASTATTDQLVLSYKSLDGGIVSGTAAAPSCA